MWNLFKVNEANEAIDVILVSLLLTLNKFHKFLWYSIADFEQVNAGLEYFEW